MELFLPKSILENQSFMDNWKLLTSEVKYLDVVNRINRQEQQPATNRFQEVKKRYRYMRRRLSRSVKRILDILQASPKERADDHLKLVIRVYDNMIETPRVRSWLNSHIGLPIHRVCHLQVERLKEQSTDGCIGYCEVYRGEKLICREGVRLREEYALATSIEYYAIP
jgi:hypothetical protein